MEYQTLCLLIRRYWITVRDTLQKNLLYYYHYYYCLLPICPARTMAEAVLLSTSSDAGPPDLFTPVSL